MVKPQVEPPRSPPEPKGSRLEKAPNLGAEGMMRDGRGSFRDGRAEQGMVGKGKEGYGRG